VAALEVQQGVDNFEVVIVDDASGDDTPQRLRELASTASLPVVPLILERNSGPAAARNRGWRASRAPLVAFTDDDCVPQPGWLSALVTGLQDADLVQGRTLPDPAQVERGGPFARTMHVTAEDGLYQTCNVAYRREVLDQVGGFDEGFRHPYGEDVDLGWRAREAGARTAFSADAVVVHDVWTPGLFAHLRDLRRREGVVRVLRRHPSLRGYLHRGVFFRASHPPAILAVLGLALAGIPGSPARRIACLSLIAPWIRHRTVRQALGRGRRQRLLILPLVFLSDVAETAVLAVHSVRQRTLVL
jgi:GT2 family glycosyltransferase